MYVVGRAPKGLVVWGPTRTPTGQLLHHLLKVTNACRCFFDFRAPICNSQHFFLKKNKQTKLDYA